jgi:hypothetical protein
MTWNERKQGASHFVSSHNVQVEGGAWRELVQSLRVTWCLPIALSLAFAYHDLNLSNRLDRLIDPLALVT